MKTKNLFIFLMLLTVSLISCSENDLDLTEPKGEEYLLIRLPDNVVRTRSVQDVVADKSVSVLDSVKVFLYSGDKLERIVDFTDEDLANKYKLIEDVPGKVNNVFALANFQDAIKDLTMADFKNMSLSEIKSYPFGVAQENKVNGINGKVLMGEGQPQADPAPSAEKWGEIDPMAIYKKVTITLDAITSRIELGAVTPGNNVSKVELIGAFINNYYITWGKDDTQFHREKDPVWNVTPVAGVPSDDENAFDNVSLDNTYTHPAYYDVAKNSEVVPGGNKCYAYHLFSGPIVPHVILLVKGEYTTYEDGKKYFMGYVTFSKYKKTDGEYVNKMEPNKIYKMGLGLEGIPINAEDITDKPEKESYGLTLTLEVTPWNAETVTPEV